MNEQVGEHELVNSVQYIVEFFFLTCVRDYSFPFIHNIIIFLSVDQNFTVPESFETSPCPNPFRLSVPFVILLCRQLSLLSHLFGGSTVPVVFFCSFFDEILICLHSLNVYMGLTLEIILLTGQPTLSTWQMCQAFRNGNYRRILCLTVCSEGGDTELSRLRGRPVNKTLSLDCKGKKSTLFGWIWSLWYNWMTD